MITVSLPPSPVQGNFLVVTLIKRFSRSDLLTPMKEVFDELVRGAPEFTEFVLHFKVLSYFLCVGNLQLTEALPIANDPKESFHDQEALDLGTHRTIRQAGDPSFIKEHTIVIVLESCNGQKLSRENKGSRGCMQS